MPQRIKSFQMKNTLFLSIFICILFIFGMSACERTELQKSAPNDLVKLETRGDCEECPDNDQCCCAIWIQGTEETANVSICGSTSGFGDCVISESGSCAETNGVFYNWEFEEGVFERAPFCVLEEGPFVITNTSSTDPALIIVTCQNSMTNPDTIWLQLPPLSRRYFHTNEECEIEPCE